MKLTNKLKNLKLNKTRMRYNARTVYSSQTGFNGWQQIDPSGLDSTRGARETSKQRVLGIHEHCERACNKAGKQNAKGILIVLGCIFCFYSISALADTNQNIAGIAKNIMESFQQLGQLMLAIAYLSGFGFVISSIFKFKQHKDNPTQIPVSTPLALLMVGIVLIFLPGILKPAGYTIFGAGAPLEDLAGGFKGTGAVSIPGGTK